MSTIYTMRHAAHVPVVSHVTAALQCDEIGAAAEVGIFGMVVWSLVVLDIVLFE